MSAGNDELNNNISCCASCGTAEIDDVKWMECDGCDLVRYCSDDCQNNHRSEHEEACKKRAAELREDLLFKQPVSSHIGDCPLCCLPLPLSLKKSSMYGCCSKFICIGCDYINKIREREMRLGQTCPFCREPAPTTFEERDKQRMKRIEVNDPVALSVEGMVQHGRREYMRAFENWENAAELGDAEAHFRLSCVYHNEDGVEMDIEKYIYHTEEAAIGGHPIARYNLGRQQESVGCIDRAVKHWIIAATQGYDNAIKALMDAFKHGQVSKDDLAATLRAHNAAVDATKSPQRKEAEENFLPYPSEGS